MIFIDDGFEHYAPKARDHMFGRSWRSSLRYTVSLPLQAWWRRLLRLDRPAQRMIVGFQFKGQEWHTVEACVIAPKGTDEVQIELGFLDGEPILIDPHTHFVAAMPSIQTKG